MNTARKARRRTAKHGVDAGTERASKRSDAAGRRPAPVWLFDLDNTLHDAGARVFGALNRSMTDYIMRELALDEPAANLLRRRYWQRYGATLLGLVRHHGVKAAHFLHDTHRLPGLEAEVSGHRHDFASIARLP